MPTYKTTEEINKEFDTMIGVLPEHGIFTSDMGDSCTMCGHPTNPNKAINNIKNFITKLRADDRDAIVEAIKTYDKEIRGNVGKTDMYDIIKILEGTNEFYKLP
jgi:uncharacterized Fe-S cluster-containing MiaB family protein